MNPPPYPLNEEERRQRRRRYPRRRMRGGSGPALVLLTGLGDSVDVFDDVAPMLPFIVAVWVLGDLAVLDSMIVGTESAVGSNQGSELMRISAGEVSLDDVRPEDHDALVDILCDNETMKWALEDRAFTRLEAKEFIRTKFASIDDPLGMRVVVCGESDRAIGFSGLRKCALLGEADLEFGWVLAKSHHGRGYATLLGRSLITFALCTLSRPRVLAACHPANIASEHVLRDKLRMQFIREVEPRPNVRRRVYSASQFDAAC